MGGPPREAGGRRGGEAAAEHADPSAAERLSPTDALRAVQLPGKGLGYVAARPLRPGEHLFTDTIITSPPWPAAAAGSLRALLFVKAMQCITVRFLRSPWRELPLYCGDPGFGFTLPQPRGVAEWCAEGEWQEAARKVRLNCFIAQLEGSRERIELAVYTSIFNHSCAPNAAVKGDAACTIAPVAEGEEVCISYRADDLYLPPAERRRVMRASHGFVCSCPRCEQPPQGVDRVIVEHGGAEGDAERCGAAAYAALRSQWEDDSTSPEDFVRECERYLARSAPHPGHWRKYQVRAKMIDALSRRCARPQPPAAAGASPAYPGALYSAEPQQGDYPGRLYGREAAARGAEEARARLLRRALGDSVEWQRRALPPLLPRRIDHAAALLGTAPDGTERDCAARRAAEQALRELAPVWAEAAAALREAGG